MYSFGLKDFSTVTGFTIQKPNKGYYVNHNASFSLYVMFVNDKVLELMKNRLQYFIDNKDTLKYDFGSLLKVFVGKDSETSKKYFCSRFVMEIIKTGIETDKVASLYKPMDIVRELNNLSLVNIGENLRDYNYKITNKYIDKIKNGSYNEDDVINEFTKQL